MSLDTLRSLFNTLNMKIHPKSKSGYVQRIVETPTHGTLISETQIKALARQEAKRLNISPRLSVHDKARILLQNGINVYVIMPQSEDEWHKNVLQCITNNNYHVAGAEMLAKLSEDVPIATVRNIVEKGELESAHLLLLEECSRILDFIQKVSTKTYHGLD